MNNRHTQKIIARYRERIEKLGHGAAAIGEPQERQSFFFHFITGADGFNKNSSILDVGCGYGDLYGYLRSTGWDGRYTGIDVNPALIEEGKRKYPAADLRVMDIEQQSPVEQFDWCFACSVLTATTEGLDYLVYLRNLLNRMWRISTQGLMFNLLSPLADYTHPFHARPPFAEVLAIMTEITNRFTLRHDYMPYDYSIYLYKNNVANRDSLIFEAHGALLQELKEKWRTSDLK